MRSVALLVSAAGLAGTIAALAVTAYSLDPQEPRQDPASEIRNSVPEPAVSATAERAAPLAPTRKPELAPSSRIAEAQPAERPLTPAATPAPRAVAPSIIAIPPVDPGSLQRVEPRPPLSTIAPAAPPKKPPPKPLLFQPVAEAAGVIVAGGRTITISGVGVVADGETCARPQGGEWPCGRAARTAFRSFLRGRAATCDFPEGEVPDTLSTTCRVGHRDIGAWLVENGWARADGGEYEELAKAAKDAGRGIYGKGPASLPPDLASPPDIPATGTAPEPLGSGDISILPGEAEAPPDDLPTAAPAALGEATPRVSPLPPPSSPLR